MANWGHHDIARGWNPHVDPAGAVGALVLDVASVVVDLGIDPRSLHPMVDPGAALVDPGEEAIARGEDDRVAAPVAIDVGTGGECVLDSHEAVERGVAQVGVEERRVIGIRGDEGSGVRGAAGPV